MLRRPGKATQVLGGAVPLIAVAVLVLAAAHFHLFASARGVLSDVLMVGYEPPPGIVVVAIDDASIREVGRWPWRRNVHAALIEKVAASGARAIGYDVNFPEPTCSSADRGEERCGDDALLAAAIEQAGNVVLPLEATFVRQAGASAPLAVRPITPIPELTAVSTLGFVNTPADADGVFRRLPLTVGGVAAERNQPFFCAVIREASLPNTACAGGGVFLVHFAGPKGTFPTVSAADVLAGRMDATLFRDAIVMIGATAPDLHDVLLTPTAKREPMPGIEVHANAIATALSGQTLQELPPLIRDLVILAAILLVGGLVLGLSLRLAVPLLGLLGAGYVIAAFVVVEAGWLLDVFFVPMAGILAAVVGLFQRLVQEKVERTRTQTILERYVSPSVAAELIAKPDMLALGGERKDMSVLFSDLRGFTSLSEKLKPEELVAVLNRYLSEMTDIVFAHHGVIDKYMGDAIMAFWGAPLADANHAVHAVETALAMRRRLAALNAEGAFPHNVHLSVGVGVNTGPMVVGNIGSAKRFDYTVMGDSVNLGSRVEGLNKDYGTDILVTETTAAALGDHFLLLAIDRVAVKGKNEPVEIFSVVEEESRADDAMRNFVRDFSAARSLYLGREFGKAQDAFAALVQSHPHHPLPQLYVTRCERFLNEAPPADWDGTIVKKTK